MPAGLNGSLERGAGSRRLTEESFPLKSGILSGITAHAARRLEKKVEGNCIMSSVKLNTKYLANYVNPDELTGIRHQVEASAKMLHEKSGLGSDFSRLADSADGL